MRFQLTDVLRLTGGKVAAPGDASVFNGVVSDSRECRAGSLFAALKGEKTDGHLYLKEAHSRGAAGALVERGNSALSGFVQIQVENTLPALLSLGRWALDTLGGHRIAFTGTVGKTTIKNFFLHLLSGHFSVEATPHSYNTPLGIALSFCGFREGSRLFLVEAGINALGEMQELYSAIRPHTVILSPIGEGHLEGLQSVERVVQEKIQLVGKGVERVYVHADNLQWDEIRSLCQRPGREVYCYGGNTSLRIEKYIFHPDTVRSSIHCVVFGSTLEIDLPFISPQASELLLPALHFALESGMSTPEIQRRVSAFLPSRGRERLYTVKGGIVIDDTYNANPVSMRKSLEILPLFQRRGYETWAVLGDMLELGRASESAHQEVIRTLVGLGIDKTILRGSLFHRAADRVLSQEQGGGGIFVASSHREVEGILHEHLGEAEKKWVVLFKGSRGMRMEESIPQFLQEDLSDAG